MKANQETVEEIKTDIEADHSPDCFAQHLETYLAGTHLALVEDPEGDVFSFVQILEAKWQDADDKRRLENAKGAANRDYIYALDVLKDAYTQIRAELETIMYLDHKHAPEVIDAACDAANMGTEPKEIPANG